MSKIEWTEQTWNPITGCSKISAGCQHCYAERMAKRLHGMGQPSYRNGFTLTCHEHLLDLPQQWRKPRLVFVNSMSDTFHEKVRVSFIKKLFGVMAKAEKHQFQVLTKRADRLAKLAPKLPWPPNIWMGVTVENEDVTDRIDHLRRVPAAVRFLSCEPLLSPLPDLDLTGIHWVIGGGESGPGARPMDKEWVLDLKRQSKKAKAAFFFKQWGGVNKKMAGRLLDGRTWDEMPLS